MIFKNDIWQEEVTFILGGGPSLKEVDLSPLHKRKVIGVNNAYRFGNWVDVCWFCDGKWWIWHHVEVQTKYKGVIAHCCDTGNLNKVKSIHCFQRGPKPNGIMTKPGHVAWNRGAGGSAINLAYHLGSRKIVLLGFDMCFVGEDKNWHRDHDDKSCLKKPKTYRKHYETSYDLMIRSFKNIRNDAATLGVEIINCSPISKISHFPIMSLSDYLKGEG